MITQKYGLPIANADNIFEILKLTGIVKWERIRDPVSVTDYLQRDFNDEEKKNLKYAPQVQVVGFRSPSGKLFDGFQISGIGGVRVFALVGGFVPICAEFHHGCEEIVLDLPGGHIEDEDEKDYATCAKREFEEETGLILEKVDSLGSRGTLINARRIRAKNFSFLGIVKEPIVFQGQHLDDNENLKTVLVSLDDWLKLIEREFVQSYSVATTFLALMKKERFRGC